MVFVLAPARLFRVDTGVGTYGKICHVETRGR